MDIGLNVKYTCWLLYRVLLNFIDDYLISKFVKIVPRRYRFMKYKPVLITVFVIGVSVQLFVFDSLTNKKLTTPTPSITTLTKPVLNDEVKTNNLSKLKIPSEAEFRMNWVKNKLDKIAKHSQRWEIMKFLDEVEPLPHPTTKVHIFYLPFFGSIDVDGEWRVWDHELVLNKIQEDSKIHSRESVTHTPPTDIASNFYPLLGCYSSKDPNVVNTHFKQLQAAGIGVVVVSWLPPHHQWSTGELLPHLLEAAGKYQLKVALHIEGYDGRDIEQVLISIKLITKKYSNHPSFYKLMRNGNNLPVFYISDSYRLPAAEWMELLAVEGERTVRGTDHDAIFIGHLRDAQNRFELQKSHFDGFYTYFASNAFTYGSTWKNWITLAKFAEKHKLLFFPSVSPGFVDTSVRPWNSALTRHRARGHYYQVAWRAALATHSYGVSITSFNNWPDGSQIEPARSSRDSHTSTLDYEPEGPYFYLNLTRYWVKQFVIQNKDDKED